jgi:hypothetical protein
MKWVMGNGLKPASHGLRVCQWKGLTEIVADAENPHVVVAAFGLEGVLHQHFEGAGEEFGAVRPVGWCCLSGRA